MSELDFSTVSAATIATPSSGTAAAFVGLDKRQKLKDSTGRVQSYTRNYSTASQAPTATTRTYITGSQIALPAAGALQIGSTFRWRLNLTKTAAGTATSTFDIAFGTAGTTSDTAQVSFTKPAGTAAADEGWIEIEAIVRGPLSASGVVSGEFVLTHNLNSTGHAQTASVVLNTISSAFDVTTPTYVGLCITTGASDAITIQQVVAEAWDI